MTRNSDERKLQITSKSWFDWSLPRVLAFHVGNEFYAGEDRKRAIIQMVLLKKMGLLPGVADWLLFWYDPITKTGKYAAIELKVDNNKLSDSQIKFRDKWIAAGGLYAECRSMPEIEEAVRSWGLKPLYAVPVANEQSGRQMRQYAAFEMFRPLKDFIPVINLTTN